MKTASFAISAAAALAAVFAAASIAQQPATSPASTPAQAPHAEHHPVPTNLQVLPKTYTGEQVHDLMHKWEADLGANCGTCHAADPKNIGPNGKPRLNYADDSKPEKATARKMYQMTELINAQYISKIETDGEPVTCGTCHQGHIGPVPFVPKHDDHDHDDHDHDHPAAAPAPAAKQ